MTQQWTRTTNTTSFDRSLGGKNPLQLSDGTLVFIYAYGTNNFALQYTTDRSATVNTIATWTTSSTQANTQFDQPDSTFGLACDASDNLYVTGTSGGKANWAFQSYTKGAGYTWTQNAFLRMGSLVSSPSYTDVVWCNTGGGATGGGHLLVQYIAASSAGGYYQVLDAGGLLAGSLTTYGSQISNLGFAAGSRVNSGLTSDGFGSPNVISYGVYKNNSGQPWFDYMTVSSAGALSAPVTSNAGAVAVNQTAKLRMVRVSAGLWAVVWPDGSTGNPVMALRTATAAVGTPTAASAGTSISNVQWDIFPDPVTPNRVVLIQVGASGAIKTLGATISGSTITWESAYTTVDTWSPCSTINSLIAVRQPTSLTVDYYGYVQTDATPTYSLYGDYLTFIPPISDSCGILLG